MAKKPQSSFPGESTAPVPTQGAAPAERDNFIDDLKNTPSNDPFAAYKQLPDTATVVTTGASFWDFEEDGNLFVGKFISPVIAVGGEQEGEIIGYNTIGPDGADRICPANYAIAKAVEENGFGKCFWIQFLGKTQSKKGQFSQFKIAVIPDFTKKSPLLQADELTEKEIEKNKDMPGA